MDYHEAWSYLDNLQFFKIKLGLESMTQFLKRCGSPEGNLKFIHVGGTNGKGSVAVNLLTILQEAGYKTGLYTSPHLSSVRERFRINDRYISRSNFASIASQIVNVLGDSQITYFEFTTALALLWFAEQEVDIAIMEVGLGGRLDATNVITPLVSVITNVSIDHEAYLGTTIPMVAAEKAGIIKQNIPVVSGVLDPLAKDVIANRAKDLNAPLYELHRDFSIKQNQQSKWNYSPLCDQDNSLIDLTPGLHGKHQAENLSLALASLELIAENGFSVDSKTIYQTVKNVFWPGRIESFECDDGDGHAIQYLLDGAHNPAGISALLDALQNDFQYKKLILVWASMADKDIGKCLHPVVPFCDHIIFTRPEEIRSAKPSQLLEIVLGTDRHKCQKADSVEIALKRAAEIATKDDLVCIAGSLYLIGLARSILLGDIADG